MQTFGIKNLVLTITQTANPAGLDDAFSEFDDLFQAVLSNIALMGNTSPLTDPSQQQLVYESYSNFVQSLFELMDALGSGANTWVNLNAHNQFMVPAAVRALGGAVDAYFFTMISFWPPATAYVPGASNQKAQVDTHFDSAVHAFHLATAKSSEPYSNTTVAAPTASKMRRATFLA